MLPGDIEQTTCRNTTELTVILLKTSCARASTTSGRQTPLLRAKSEKGRDLQRIEHELSDALTASVEIRVKKRTKRGEQGEVAISFGSLDELNGLLGKLGLGPR